MFRERMDWRQDLRCVAFTLCEESRLRSTLHIQRPPLSTVGSRLGGTNRCTLAVSCRSEETNAFCRYPVRRRTSQIPTKLALVRKSTRPNVLTDDAVVAEEEGFDPA